MNDVQPPPKTRRYRVIRNCVTTCEDDTTSDTPYPDVFAFHNIDTCTKVWNTKTEVDRQGTLRRLLYFCLLLDRLLGLCHRAKVPSVRIRTVQSPRAGPANFFHRTCGSSAASSPVPSGSKNERRERAANSNNETPSATLRRRRSSTRFFSHHQRPLLLFQLHLLRPLPSIPTNSHLQSP